MCALFKTCNRLSYIHPTDIGQKCRCRVGRAVTHPGPSPDPDKEISTIRLFRRCGSWLYVATTSTSSGDMLSNVSALGMVPSWRSHRHGPPLLGRVRA